MRLAAIRDVADREWLILLLQVQRETGSVLGLWHDTPSGFVQDVLGETVWSRQREILGGIADRKPTAVPAAFGVGKMHLAGTPPDQPALTQTHQVAARTPCTATPSITGSGILAADDARHGHTADSPAITQVHEVPRVYP